MTLDDLQQENAELKRRVDTLQAVLYGNDEIEFPLGWKLTKAESRIVGALLRNALVSKDMMIASVYHKGSHKPNDPMNVIAVMMHSIRRKLSPFGVTIHTEGHKGYRIDLGTNTIDHGAGNVRAN